MTINVLSLVRMINVVNRLLYSLCCSWFPSCTIKQGPGRARVIHSQVYRLAMVQNICMVGVFAVAECVEIHIRFSRYSICTIQGSLIIGETVLHMADDWSEYR
jgi:hypothetical protein